MGDARPRIVIIAECGLAGALLSTPAARSDQPPKPSPAKAPVATEKQLSEATKKQIYWEGFSIEHKAVRAANERYPIDYSRKDVIEQIKVNGSYGDALIAKDETALRRKYSITKDQYSKIFVEGAAKKWPRPSSQP